MRSIKITYQGADDEVEISKEFNQFDEAINWLDGLALIEDHDKKRAERVMDDSDDPRNASTEEIVGTKID